jgi:hypothetical protein
MRSSIGSIIAGVLVIVVGLVLSSTILTQAAASGSAANIGSFSGARDLNDLVPLIYYAGIVVISLGLMALGGAGVTGRGPLGAKS